MSWNISHGGTQYGYSYSGVAELSQRLSGILTRSDYRQVSKAFNRRSGDPFAVKPKQAGEIGSALHLAAGYLPSDWAAMARQIGDSALLAARLGEPWRWS